MTPRAEPQPQLRIGDAEREQAVTALGEHYLAGRLTKDEYDERAAAAWAARTMSHLQPLFADLPALQKQVAPAPVPRARQRDRRRFALPAFPLGVALLVLLVLVGAPWWAWMVLAWLWCSGMLTGLAGGACRNMRHRA